MLPPRAHYYDERLNDTATMAEKHKPPVLADLPSAVIYLFCARNIADPQDKS